MAYKQKLLLFLLNCNLSLYFCICKGQTPPKNDKESDQTYDTII